MCDNKVLHKDTKYFCLKVKSQQIKLLLLFFKVAYHLVASVLLGFPYVFEESTAHLFGVPRRHEHGVVLLFDQLVIQNKLVDFPPNNKHNH